MARPLRIEYAGAIYHLTSRGNGRAAIFLSDDDRRLFLSLVGEIVLRNQWVCHGYCLMDNHYHLLIETTKPNLCVGMRQLGGIYTQKFNRQHGRVGHLFLKYLAGNGLLTVLSWRISFHRVTLNPIVIILLPRPISITVILSRILLRNAGFTTQPSIELFNEREKYQKTRPDPVFRQSKLTLLW